MAENVSSSEEKRFKRLRSPVAINTSKKSRNTAFPGIGNHSAMNVDTGNPSIENAVIPRPICNTYTTGCQLIFRKNHLFLSYGIGMD